jgi:hypothetical protein
MTWQEGLALIDAVLMAALIALVAFYLNHMTGQRQK